MLKNNTKTTAQKLTFGNKNFYYFLLVLFISFSSNLIAQNIISIPFSNGFVGDSNTGVYSRSNGNVNTNPYFTSSAIASFLDVGQWYLYVGHVHESGAGTGSADTDSGKHTIAGGKISNFNDFVWREENNRTRQRVYLYYSTIE
jgi:hypothetical protein